MKNVAVGHHCQCFLQQQHTKEKYAEKSAEREQSLCSPSPDRVTVKKTSVDGGCIGKSALRQRWGTYVFNEGERKK